MNDGVSDNRSHTIHGSAGTAILFCFVIGLGWLIMPDAGLAATISGRVVHQASQAGIPDVAVGFISYGLSKELRHSFRTTTDATGLFVFDIDTTNSFSGYIHIDDDQAIYRPEGFSDRIEWDGEKQDKEVLIERIPSLVVTGRLVTASSEPVAGAVVQSIVERATGTSIFRAETDGADIFHIRLDAGDHDIVMDDHRYYIDPLRLAVALDEAIDSLVITTRPTSKLEGVIRNADGTPRANLEVWAGAWVYTNLIVNRTRTDTNGEFFVGIPHAGPLDIGIKAHLDSHQQTLLTNVVVQADAAPATVAITLPPGSLSGLVRLDPARPRMAILSIEAKTPPRTWMSTTDMEGRYQLPWLTDGEYVITVIASGSPYNLMRGRFLVQDGQVTTDADFSLGNLMLCGRVFDPGGQPVTNGHVEVRSETGSSHMIWESRVEVGTDGRYCASNLIPGVVTVRAMSHGALFEKRDVDLSSPRHELDFASFGTNTWAGQLVDELGTGISQGVVRVYTRHEGLIVNRAAFTDEAGRFSIDNLPDGRCLLVASGPAGFATPTTHELPDTRLTNQTITIAETTGYIEGHLTSMFEYGVPFTITTDLGDGFFFDLLGFTRPDGSYRIDHLPDGSYELKVHTTTGDILHPVRIEQGSGVRADFVVQTAW